MSYYGQTFNDYELLARTFLVLGPNWQPTRYSDMLTVSKLMDNIDSLGYGAKLAILLTYLLRPGVNVPTRSGHANNVVDELMADLLNSFRVQGSTAYASWQRSGGQAYALPYDMQGMILSCFSMTSNLVYRRNPMVEKLANWVAQGNSRSGGLLFAYRSADFSHALFGLSDYDSSRSSTDPNLTLDVKSGSMTPLHATFNSPQDPVISRNASFSELTNVNDTPVDLVIVATGTGEVDLAVGLQFVPSLNTFDPVYRGLYVNRAVRRVSAVTGLPMGKPVQVVEVGAIVEVRIEITSPDDVTNVLLEDLIPGGLEPIDPALTRAAMGSSSTGGIISTVSGQAPDPLAAASSDNSGISASSAQGPAASYYLQPDWYTPFGAPEVMTDRVRWSAPYFFAGTSSVSYRAIAVTGGKFLQPPARAKCLTVPEVMGLSSAGHFLVSEALVMPDDVQAYLQAQRAITVDPILPLKECTVDCTDQESCNLKVGMCLSTVGRFNSSTSYQPQPPASTDGPYQPENPNNPQQPTDPTNPVTSGATSYYSDMHLPESLMIALSVMPLAMQCLVV